MGTRRRRGAGEGTIRERKDGRWEGRLIVGRDQAGRLRTRSVYAPTRAAVVPKLDALKGTLAAGLPAPSERLTVGAYLTQWVTTVEPRLRLSTRRRYGQLVRGQLVPALGLCRLARLTVSDVEGMMAKVQADGLSARTAGHCRAVLRAALSDAERDGLVGRNVARLARAPHVAPPHPTVLRPDEAREVVASLSDPGLRRLATIAIGTGLRQGELLGLRWEDVDAERRSVRVRSVLVPLGGSYGLAEPKSASSRRVVPVGEYVLQALSEERQAQREAKLAAGRRWREVIPDLCFTTATGAPRNGNALTHSFQDALAAAGLARLTWHDLRAAHGALLLQSGTDISVVSRQLGHGSVGVTARHYGGVADSLGREAADRLEALIGHPS
jgi:integrase